MQLVLNEQVRGPKESTRVNVSVLRTTGALTMSGPLCALSTLQLAVRCSADKKNVG